MEENKRQRARVSHKHGTAKWGVKQRRSGAHMHAQRKRAKKREKRKRDNICNKQKRGSKRDGREGGRENVEKVEG